MSSEFEVMPWLRALRDRHAKELAGLSTQQILRRTRERSGPLMKAFLKAHPEARRAHENTVSRVAEDRAEYGKK